jgi:hypothetical protein
MLINYKPEKAHILTVALIPVTEEQEKLKQERGQVKLLPGVNEVTDNEWAVMKAHVEAKIKSGVIAVIETDVKKSKESPDGKARNLKKTPAKKAVELIKECVSPDTLKKWYQEETRQELRLLIVEKMRSLNIELPDLEFTGGEECGAEAEGAAGNGGGAA